MDPMFLAMSLCRRRKYEQCVEICSEILSKNPYDQVSVVSFDADDSNNNNNNNNNNNMLYYKRDILLYH